MHGTGNCVSVPIEDIPNENISLGSIAGFALLILTSKGPPWSVLFSGLDHNHSIVSECFLAIGARRSPRRPKQIPCTSENSHP